MKGQTKIFIYLLIILSFITLFSISCNNNKDKTGTEERKLSYYAGDWWGKRKDEATETNILTINHDGSFNLKAAPDPDLVIPSYSVTRVSDTNYTASYNETNSVINFIFIFSSDTQGKLTMEFQGTSDSVNINKKQ